MKDYMKEKYPNIHSNHYVVDYCSYDDNIGYKKTTIFWTNIKGFDPKRCLGKGKCKNMEGSRHRINMACNAYYLDKEGKIVLVNSKEKRQECKDQGIELLKRDSSGDKYNRYKIPFKLIEEFLSLC